MSVQSSQNTSNAPVRPIRCITPVKFGDVGMDGMPFVKKVKSDAYFSRFQVKYRRRREGKTDYYARKRLVTQAKNKYNAPKYRLVVRFTNKTIVVQIVYARLQGDFVLTAASSRELPRYGINHGLTNWAAAYATGLLCARRALTKLGLADKYEGVTEADGTFTVTETLDEEDAPRPFKCYLDVGLKRTSTGSRVFGAMKGASDGGIYIPHSEKRFPGYDPESKELDAEVLKKYIFGGHVAEYMESLEEEDDERFKKQFATYLADGIGSEDIEEIYTNAHAAIREDPVFKPTEKSKDWKAESEQYRTKKLTLAQRQANIAAKIEKFKAGGDAEDDEDDE
ncbi:60S ribosomal protein L5-B [Hypsizygus marmoreus]|uniref:60S ribosomal protein L5-B n=1 Tax=Hypsizygus marmoreus TaxID=39966 RepID=A0A369JMV8_HYPMA|nr:60S ribosomal protein L5-B [Hypsizygus marmoreus]